MPGDLRLNLASIPRRLTGLSCSTYCVLAICLMASYVDVTGSAHAQEALRDGAIDTSVSNIELSHFEFGEPGSTIATYHYLHPGAKYLRLEFSDLELKPNEQLTLLNAYNEVILSANGALKKLPSSSFFIRGPGLTIRMTRFKATDERAVVKSIFYQETFKSPLKSIFGANKMVNVNSYPNDSPISSDKRAIVFISFIDNDAPKVCSGFLISSRAVMTNYHCVHNDLTCRTTSVIFDYEKTASGEIRLGQTRQCLSVRGDPELDYAVVELDTPVDSEIVPLRLASADGGIGAPAALIQHPGGDYKQVAESGCQILDLGVPGKSTSDLSTDFSHRCDTVQGSSGSPIISWPMLDGPQNCVIGLHHWGFVAGDEKFETRNRAVRMPLIANSLKEINVPYASCLPQGKDAAK